ncbi:NPCBM/NEW2 domain-containing protein [Actinomyces bowdenii]|uniref:NPCBM/NEW2 domain-containing protein n=1 Tax=Actinomyces bowdenii TaxID=131109 RepID=UPI00214BC812|nr:NPCBM/NEW2 domain-containing protein [Actinomyces bowdenii]
MTSQTNGVDKDGADIPSPITQSDTAPEPDPDVNEKPAEPNDETDKDNTPVTLTEASPLPQEVYATDLGVIDKSSDLAVNKDASVDGVLYESSILHQCLMYCNEKDGIGVVEFNLNKEFTIFTVNVGVLQQTKDPSQIGTFIVYVDGVEKDARQVAYGKPDFISVDVSGGVRLKLVSSREGEITGPIESGLNATQGDPNILPDLVWGSPQLHR